MDSTIAESSPSPAQDELDALDRGVIDAGLTAARALARSEVLEQRVRVLERDLLDAYRALGAALGVPPPRLPARHRARERWNMTAGA